MQTELRVIDLGERGGRVVRRFPVRAGVRYSCFPSTVVKALREGLITKVTAYYWLEGQGYPDWIIEQFISLAERG